MKGKNILITGGTGSFGKTVAKRLTEQSPNNIIIYSRDEEKHWRMKNIDGLKDFNYIIGDVRDKDKLKKSFKNIDIIFHAAALKHVPICEEFPEEAVSTNILGSKNVIEAAIEMSVERVVGLSTDKAVNPLNAMGMSKGIMEKLFCSQNSKNIDTIFSCTRYGNVMGSRGSVIPLFIQQIKEGKSLTITEKSMTRFMMSLQDSVDLVFFAMQNSVGGEIFIKKSPGTTVSDLAQAMTKFYRTNIDIEEVGIRPGEKRHEILMNEFESRKSLDLAGYYLVNPDYKVEKIGQNSFEYRSDNTEQISDHDEIIKMLLSAKVIS